MERSKVAKSKVDLFIATNSSKFDVPALLAMRDSLERMDDDQFLAVSAGEFRDPTLILLVAIFLGWDRFFLDDVGMGILKVLTCYGLGVWWLIDLFSAVDRTKRYNYNKFIRIKSLIG